MFNLIITVVAILLLAIIAFATLYFGFGAHDDAKAKALYAGHMNTAQQIEGAMKLYTQEHGYLPNLTDQDMLDFLVAEKYLNDAPEGGWKVQPGALYRPLYKPNETPSIEQCAAVNRVAGFDVTDPDVGLDSTYKGCPPCNGEPATTVGDLAEAFKRWPGCQFVATGTGG